MFSSFPSFFLLTVVGIFHLYMLLLYACMDEKDSYLENIISCLDSWKGMVPELELTFDDESIVNISKTTLERRFLLLDYQNKGGQVGSLEGLVAS